MFKVFIATPESIVFNASIASLKAPGTDGYFEVLQDHAAFISSLVPGKLELTDSAGKKWLWAVSGGFIEVFNNEVSVLLDSAELPEKIDISRAEKAFAKAEQLLSSTSPSIDRLRAKRALARAKNRIEIAKGS